MLIFKAICIVKGYDYVLDDIIILFLHQQRVETTRVVMCEIKYFAGSKRQGDRFEFWFRETSTIDKANKSAND